MTRVRRTQSHRSVSLGVEPVEQVARPGLGGGQRHVVDVTHPEERGDVGFVGLGGQGVTEEDDAVDGLVGDLAGDLDVATERPGGFAFDGQIRLLGDPLARRRSAEEVVVG